MAERAAAPQGYEWQDFDAGGGRTLEVLIGGRPDGFPLVFHSGTPSGAAPFPLLVEAAGQRSFRTIGYSRPGYGTSGAAPGRKVRDGAADTATILDSLGYGRFVALGWSGGGPHTLACAALLGDRCVGAAVIASPAPSSAEGLDWADGMGAENLVEFELARKGGAEFESFLEMVHEVSKTVSDPASVADLLGDLVTDGDRDTILNHGLGEYLMAAMSQAMLVATDGWRDDDVAFLTEWGFDPSAVDRPVRIWHGTDDRMVPLGHGRWLADRVPGATIEIAAGEGHISITRTAIPRLLDELAALAALG